MADSFPVWPGWKTVKLIGRGSFGAVYEIERRLPDGSTEKAALKVITIPQNDGDINELRSNGLDDQSITEHFNDYLAHIVREYSLMADVKGHTNVVTCDDIRWIQNDDGFGWTIYIKMELLTPLDKVLDGTIPEEQAVQIGKDIANALILCQSRNIIHRDIKPQNIFVSKDGNYKLGDFGIARTMDGTGSATHRIGTFNYMAPEVNGDAPYDHTVDIYSLGMVLYFLLNERRLPFYPLPPAVPRLSDMENARYRRFRGETIPAPIHGSEGLKQVVLKACAFDPKDRYQSAEEMRTDLEKLEPGRKPAIKTEIMPPVSIPDEFSAKDAETVGLWAGKGMPNEEPASETVRTEETPSQKEPVQEMPSLETPLKEAGETVGIWTSPTMKKETPSKQEAKKDYPPEEIPYQKARDLFFSAKTLKQFRETAEAFEQLGDYKDSRTLAANCRKKEKALEEKAFLKEQAERAKKYDEELNTLENHEGVAKSKSRKKKGVKTLFIVIILVVLAVGFVLFVAGILGGKGLLNYLKNRGSLGPLTREDIDYVKADPVTPSGKDGTVNANDYKTMYPEIVVTMKDNAKNTYVTNYLEQAPYLVNIYEGFGFAKDYGSARGHEYTLVDVQKTERPHPLANCLTCKTPNFAKLVNDMGVSAYTMDFNEAMALMEEDISCYTCHGNEANDSGKLVVTHNYVIKALGDNVGSIDPATLSCGQCHIEYYFTPTDKETMMPYSDVASMDPEAILKYYDEMVMPDGSVGFYDWVQASTGTKMLKAQHPEMETFLAGKHASALNCADCHMAIEMTEEGKVYMSHELVSPLKNEALLANCYTCHTDVDDMVVFVQRIQARVTAKETEVGNRLSEFKDALAQAVSEGKMSEEELDAVRKLHREAQWFFDFCYVENAEGAHNSELAFRCLELSETRIAEGMELLGLGE